MLTAGATRTSELISQIHCPENVEILRVSIETLTKLWNKEHPTGDIYPLTLNIPFPHEKIRNVNFGVIDPRNEIRWCAGSDEAWAKLKYMFVLSTSVEATVDVNEEEAYRILERLREIEKADNRSVKKKVKNPLTYEYRVAQAKYLSDKKAVEEGKLERVEVPNITALFKDILGNRKVKLRYLKL